MMWKSHVYVVTAHFLFSFVQGSLEFEMENVTYTGYSELACVFTLCFYGVELYVYVQAVFLSMLSWKYQYIYIPPACTHAAYIGEDNNAMRRVLYFDYEPKTVAVQWKLYSDEKEYNYIRWMTRALHGHLFYW